MKKIKTKYKVLILLILFLVIYIGKNVFDICAFSAEDQKCRADVSVILGAAAYNGEVSPVYRERINHGITLYEEGYVDRLIVTGGTADQAEESDASAAKKYLLSQGSHLSAHCNIKRYGIPDLSDTLYRLYLHSQETFPAVDSLPDTCLVISRIWFIIDLYFSFWWSCSDTS